MGFTKADAQSVATEKAKAKIAAEPERFAKIADPQAKLAAARSEVYAEDADLRELHREADPDEPIEVEEPVVEKGAPALAKRDAAVAELRKIYPEKSVAELRVMAWQQNPQLREEYRRLTS